MKLIILLAVVTTALAGSYGPRETYQSSDSSFQFPWWRLEEGDEQSERSNQRYPFPECLQYGEKSTLLKQGSLGKRYEKAVYDEEKSSNYELYENQQKKYNEPMDYDTHKSKDGHGYRSSASALTKITSDIMNILRCDLNGTDAKSIDDFLRKFKLSDRLCNFDSDINCDGKRAYRTITGICNNEKHPLQGSAQSAYGRILPADYDDNVSKPRRKARRGGYLPGCRKISLEFGTKPNFDRSFNNFFTIFGQYIGHDISFAAPVSDKYLSPISSCTCSAKYDHNKCTVIDIAPDDPYLSGQKCMAFPATAQALKDQYCSLGRKEQLNGNTPCPDLSTLYGSTDPTAAALISYNGTLKSTRKTWAKYEYPPAQREGKSCVDPTYKRPCFAGGDSRVVENLLFTGIQSIFLRAHNIFAKGLRTYHPQWSDMEVYERARAFLIEYYQAIVYGYWVPKLLGPLYGLDFVTKITSHGYDPNIPPVVYNEVAVAAFRCHTLVRDLFSRCTPDGKRIDELWLNDISHKVKYAYDAENNGVDSFLCGSFYDYGFAHDGNFAHQIRDRLFESTDNYGHYWRNDLASINICRCREHGIRNFNDYREYCGFPKAYKFRDFGDTINYEGIKLLEKIYKHPDDVELFVGLNLEDALTAGLVGPVSACLLTKQFQDLCAGDRFCVAHKHPLKPNSFSLAAVALLDVLICNTVDIEQIPIFAFSPPNEVTNPLVNCSLFKDAFDRRFFEVIALDTKQNETQLEAESVNLDIEQAVERFKHIFESYEESIHQLMTTA